MNVSRLLLAVLLVTSSPKITHAQQVDPHVQSWMQQMEYSTDAVSPHRFVAAHGSRAVIMGYPDTGLEVWAYPFELLGNYLVSFKQAGANASKDARQLLRRVDYRPDSIVRTYVGPDFLVRERIFIPLDQAAAVVTYEEEGIRPVDIEVHFTPVLNLMWPGGLGGQYTRWKGVEAGSNGVPGFVIAGQGNDLAAIIGSREITAHDDTVNSTVLTEHGYSFALHPVSHGSHLQATVYIALNAAGDDATLALSKFSAELSQLEQEAAAHYAALDAGSLRIHTPDEEINRSLAWAKVALDQAWVCNPRLGCGVVAGYGPSRDALRPQYAWYFGGDGLVATNALVAAGEYGRARDELRFIQKYQDPKNGMIWHELSQSAGYMDWLKLPFMYVHVDTSFDYLDTVARYVEASGDIAFATQGWPSIVAVYNYCRSSIGPDNLPHIPADKEASDEQHRPADDLNLSASWVAAAAGYAQLARLTGHISDADVALRQVQAGRQAIREHYWNAAQNFWFDGHTASGEPIDREAIGPTQLIPDNVFSVEQNEALLDRLTSADFQADWGMREVAASAKDYNPYSYGAGSVSPLSTMAAAVSLWQAHRPESALALWRSTLDWSTFDAMGHVHEVLDGNFYQEQTESVPEQTWSSAALFDGTVRGLFGLQLDAAANRVTLAPHIPAFWSEVSLDNVKMPQATLGFTYRQSEDSLDLDVTNEGAQTSVTFQPQIPRGARITSADFEGRSLPARISARDGDEHAEMTFAVPPGRSHCHLGFSGGVAISLRQDHPRTADYSKAPKIIKVIWKAGTLNVDADVSPDQEAVFTLRSPWAITTIKGATVSTAGHDEYELRMRASAVATTPVKPAATASPSYTRIHAAIGFDHAD